MHSYELIDYLSCVIVVEKTINSAHLILQVKQCNINIDPKQIEFPYVVVN